MATETRDITSLSPPYTLRAPPYFPVMFCFRRAFLRTLSVRSLAGPPRPPAALLSVLEGPRGPWGTVRRALLAQRQFNESNVDAQILSYLVCSNDTEGARSYLKFMDEERLEWGLSTISRYFQLVRTSSNGKSVDSETESAVLRRYDELRRRYPVLDPITLEGVVSALSLTEKWRLCVGLLDEIRVAGAPKTTATEMVISAAFVHGDDELAWGLLGGLIELDDRVPNDDVFDSYLGRLRGSDRSTVVDKLETLFEFVRVYDLELSEGVALEILGLCRSLGENDGAFVMVGPDGACKNCGRNLKRCELTDQEFETLKTDLFDRVIVGRDVFLKTDPVELEGFKRMIDKEKQYDVIIDGLNVAYSVGTKQPQQVLSAMLAGVVSHFAPAKILVVGRLHLRGLPKRDWDHVNRNADVFLAKNLSQDDPYLLYFALSSGKETKIVTRDLMRGQRSLMGGARARATFDRWLSQRRHQLVRFDGYRPVFRAPPEFTSTAQKSGSTWHVPYAKRNAVGAPQQAEHYHKHWLCLSL